MDKPTIVLSLAAGLLGGMLTHSLTPMAVHAQAPPPPLTPLPPSPPAGQAPQTLRLPISLVDQAGYVVGAIVMDPDGLPNIKLYDNSQRSSKGGLREIWSARGVTVRPVTQ